MLARAVKWCKAHAIGAFRVLSGFLPIFTHPEVGWTMDDDAWRGVRSALRAIREHARVADIRLSFHPDQFVVLGSATPSVVTSSLRELEYLAEVAELIGAEQMTIHGGGAQGGKLASLERLVEGIACLSPRARSRIALENDDRVYTVEDLLPVCHALGVPLIYDVHHHRCLPDALSVERATELAAETWHGREPWTHVSSPARGWGSSDARSHADFVKPADLPREWLSRTMTVDVEAKAKEVAVLRLRKWLDLLSTAPRSTAKQ